VDRVECCGEAEKQQVLRLALLAQDDILFFIKN
jgi:hypothetical protein